MFGICKFLMRSDAVCDDVFFEPKYMIENSEIAEDCNDVEENKEEHLGKIRVSLTESIIYRKINANSTMDFNHKGDRDLNV